MHAIITKIIPATNTKPTRIKAQCARGKITIGTDALNALGENLHRAAAINICNRFVQEDWDCRKIPIAKNPWS